MNPLPRYAYLSPHRQERQAELTRQGVYDLMPSELFWQSQQQFLKERGYVLRRRYLPGWHPSWVGTNLDPTYCEDSIQLNKYNVIDATDIHNNHRVSIKHTRRDTEEIEIGRFLASIHDSRNHTVSLLEVMDDTQEPGMCFLVMPYLRPFNDPDFEAVGEVVDFVIQTLEGLAFMHKHRVAHRDVAAANTMMDGRALYPNGHHPVRRKFSEDAVYELTPLSRLEHPVRYFFIDFGISVRFAEGARPDAIGIKGRCKEAPEMSFDVPYDAFKVDVFALGTLYLKEFIEVYHGLEFLQPLVDAMTQPDPAKRLTAVESMTLLNSIRSQQTSVFLRWRLRSRTETTSERVVYDTVAVAREGLYHLKRLVA
uniref:N/A n=1 Tax=Ganoderma boninense TaxID=34458 RepID=A0A5K1K636_9APHY|nr:N/A [Ganoderma boninense]